jgi:hypothetical protein
LGIFVLFYTVKTLISAISFLFFVSHACAQKLDSIYFNLYTDSLKKGTYNYINVEGRYSDGRYLPMSTKEVKFTSSAGKFDRNSLFIDTSFKGEKVVVQASAISNPALKVETVIYIKKYIADERLPTVDEVLKGQQPSRNKRTKRRG